MSSPKCKFCGNDADDGHMVDVFVRIRVQGHYRQVLLGRKRICNECQKMLEERTHLSPERRKHLLLEQMLADPNDDRHGTYTGYRYGCRCEKCEKAGHEHRRLRRIHENGGGSGV